MTQKILRYISSIMRTETIPAWVGGSFVLLVLVCGIISWVIGWCMARFSSSNQKAAAEFKSIGGVMVFVPCVLIAVVVLVFGYH